MAAYYTHQVQKAQAEHNLMQSDYRCKAQVLFPFLNEIIQKPAMKHIVTELLGPDVHCWDTLFWNKKAGDGHFVSFHQDATYWNFAPKDAVTVWFSFNGSTEEKGAIRYMLGSHLQKQREHRDIKAEGNLLMRGQTVEMQIRKSTIATVPAGCVSIHHPHIIHGSGPNVSKEDRIACGFIFAAGHVKPILNRARERTLWVYGEDKYGYFDHDPVPDVDIAANIPAWQLAYDTQHANYYHMEHAVFEK